MHSRTRKRWGYWSGHFLAGLARACLCGGFFVFSSQGQADDDPFGYLFGTALPSSVTLEAGGDSASAKHADVDLDLALPSGYRLLLGAGDTHVESAPYRYTTRSVRVGINSDALEPWSYGLRYARERRDDGLRFDTLSGSLRYRMQDWSFMWLPEMAYIRIELPNKNTLGILRSFGGGISANYYGFDPWSLSLSRYGYRYSSAPLQQLRSRPRIATRIGEFDETRTRLGVDYGLRWGLVGVQWIRSASALNTSISQSTALELVWNTSSTWSLFAQVGSSSSADAVRNRFAAAGISFYWD